MFKDFGLYNTDFSIAGDYEFFIRCLLKPGVTTEHIPEFITLFDGNGISNDTSHIELQVQERENAWKLNVSEMTYESLKKQNAFSLVRRRNNDVNGCFSIYWICSIEI